MKSRSVHCITVWRQYLKLAAKFNISWSILFTFCSRIRNLLEVRFTLASQAGKTRCTLWIRSSENSKLMFEYEGPFTGVICITVWRQYLKLAAKFNISWSILFTFCSRIRNLLEVRFTLASQAGKTRCTLWIRSSENSKLMFEYEGPFTGVICLLIACSFFVWCVWLAIRSLTRN